MTHTQQFEAESTVSKDAYAEQVTYRVLRRMRPAVLAATLKRLLRIERRIIRTDTGSYFIDPVSNLGTRLLLSGEYEPETLSSLQEVVRPGTTFVDVGANEGYFTVAAANLVGPHGRVVAIEPQSRARDILYRNLELNNLHNVSVFRTAISNECGQGSLYLAPEINTGSSGLSRCTSYPLRTECVPTLTLEACLAEGGLDRVDALKMDIEGFEYEAILGSPAVFRERRISALILELHETLIRARGLASADISDFLTSCGYRQNSASRLWLC